MLGLSFEKILIIGIIAAVIIGPERLPQYAAKLGEFIRNFRDFTAATKARTESELGVPLDTDAWSRQIRQYDPRVLVKDALSGTDAATTAAATATSEPVEPAAPVASAEPVASAAQTETSIEESAPTDVPAPDPAPAMRERWVIVGGSSGHPIRRKILEPVPDTAADDDADLLATAATPPVS